MKTHSTPRSSVMIMRSVSEIFFRFAVAGAMLACAFASHAGIVVSSAPGDTICNDPRPVAVSSAGATVNNIAGDISPVVYNKVEYKGFRFDVPENCQSSGSSSLVIRSVDGRFGISVDVGDANGSDRKRVAGLCTDLARSMRLKNAKVENVKVNGMKGAVATGRMEGRDVTIAIFPSGQKEIRCIMIYDPANESWARRFLSSLSPL